MKSSFYHCNVYSIVRRALYFLFSITTHNSAATNCKEAGLLAPVAQYNSATYT